MSRRTPLPTPPVTRLGTFVEWMLLSAGFDLVLATERQVKRPAAKAGATG